MIKQRTQTLVGSGISICTMGYKVTPMGIEGQMGPDEQNLRFKSAHEVARCNPSRVGHLLPGFCEPLFEYSTGVGVQMVPGRASFRV
jgi:hypothetical protein